MGPDAIPEEATGSPRTAVPPPLRTDITLALSLQGPAQVIRLGHRCAPLIKSSDEVSIPRRPPHTFYRLPAKAATAALAPFIFSTGLGKAASRDPTGVLFTRAWWHCHSADPWLASGQAISVRSSVTPSIASVLARRWRRGTAIDAGSTTWLSNHWPRASGESRNHRGRLPGSPQP